MGSRACEARAQGGGRPVEGGGGIMQAAVAGDGQSLIFNLPALTNSGAAGTWRSIACSLSALPKAAKLAICQWPVLCLVLDLGLTHACVHALHVRMSL